MNGVEKYKIILGNKIKHGEKFGQRNSWNCEGKTLYPWQATQRISQD
jgi:hypothetical protein